MVKILFFISLALSSPLFNSFPQGYEFLNLKQEASLICSHLDYHSFFVEDYKKEQGEQGREEAVVYRGKRDVSA